MMVISLHIRFPTGLCTERYRQNRVDEDGGGASFINKLIFFLTIIRIRLSFDLVTKRCDKGLKFQT